MDVTLANTHNVVMSERVNNFASTDGGIEFSNSRDNIGAVALLMLLPAVLGLMLLGKAAIGPSRTSSLPAPQGEELAVLAGLLALLFVCFAGLACIIARQSGRWIADEQGITFTPMLGRRRSVRWCEVVRLRWTRQTAVVDAGGWRVTIPWATIRSPIRDLARTFLRQRLSAYFRIEPDPVIAPLAINWLRVLAAVIPSAVVIFILFWLLYTDPIRFRWLALVLGSFPILWCIVALVVGCRLKRQHPNHGAWLYRRPY